MVKDFNSLMSHLETTGALCFDHSDSPRDLNIRRLLEEEISVDPDLEIVSESAYLLLARKKRK